MSLLDGPDWRGQIFTGVWQHSAGGDSAVMEPATGTELGRVGLAGPDDVSASAPQAAIARAIDRRLSLGILTADMARG